MDEAGEVRQHRAEETTDATSSAPDRAAAVVVPEDAGTRDEIRVTIGGIVAWVVALVLLATVFRHDLERHHTTWWIWSCVIGIVLGGYGLRFALRRRHR